MPKHRRHVFLLVIVSAAMLAAAMTGPTAQAVGPPRTTGPRPAVHAVAGHDTRTARAERALVAAQGLFAPKAHSRAMLVRHGRDATLVLNRLMQLRDALTGAQRAQADRLLARPTSPGDPGGTPYQPGAEKHTTCGVSACVHWVSTTSDQPDLTDTTPANGIPDYVDTTLALVQDIRSTYQHAGYRVPEADGKRGGNGKIDIYLVDVGPSGLYGYCTSDKRFNRAGPYDGWAYCVFDNDFDPSEFGTANTPLENLQVTAAHEFFHAVQFAYDAFEDGWFMEATATWAEDELYDDVDDNLQYLPFGPQAQPWIPLDKFTDMHQYGDWIFFRYLTERMPTSAGGLPTLVREMWKKADGSARGPDQYSIQAVRSVLHDRHVDFNTAFASFSEANRRPASTYEEGAANLYPTAPLGQTFTLTPSATAASWRPALDHLTAAIARYEPSSLDAGWRLRISVDAPATARGSVALVTTYPTSGDPTVTKLPLSTQGNVTRSFGFASSDVTAIEVTLANAGTHYTCREHAVTGTYSCAGKPQDDHLTFSVRGTAFQ